MAVFERETRIRAPLSEVWDFHSTVDGLRALTPSWLHLRVEGIERPADAETDVLVAGTRLDLSVRPFGAGPRQRWSSVIEERKEGDGVAFFVDTMADGPVPAWRHLHVLYDDDEETLLRDRVTYEPPGHSTFGSRNPFDPPLRVGLDVFFRYRHRRTRESLESR